jgi:hypothetical protein
MSNMHRSVFAALFLAISTVAVLAPEGRCQRAVVSIDPETKAIEMKAMTPSDLKQAIGMAMESGDIDTKDGTELLNKITDIETLMEQFDFIREHERSMIGVHGSAFF